jgi:hypothetical protein
MPIYGLDAAGNAAYIDSTGAGSIGDPYIVKNDLETSELKSAFVNASGNADIVSGVTSTKLRVMSMAITTSGACNVRLQSGGSVDLTPRFFMPANGNMTISNPLGLFESASGAKLNAVLSGSTSYGVMVAYREVPA